MKTALRFFFVALALGVTRLFASYSQNFDALTAGAPVSGWTSFGGTFVVLTRGNVSSPNSYGVTTPTDGDVAVYTAGTDNTDQEIAFSQVVHFSSPYPSVIDPVLRGNSGGTTGYLVAFSYDVSPVVTLYKFSGAGFVAIGTASSITRYLDGETVFIKAKIVGTQVSYKIWKSGDTEPSYTSPGSWTGDTTYATGYAGLRHNQSYAGAAAADDVVISAVAGSLTAGSLSNTALAATTATNVSTAATGGTAPYTYQWYMDTNSGFTPGGGNILSGATSLTLNKTGLTASTTYYFKVVATDNVSATATSSQLTITTSAPTFFTVSGTTPVVPFSGSSYDSKNLAAPSVWRNTLCRVDSATGKLTTSAVGGTVTVPKWMMQYSAFNTSSYSVGATTIGAGTWTLGLAYSDLLAGPWTALAANTSAFNGGNPVDYPHAGDGSYLASNGGIIEFTASSGSLSGQNLLYHFYDSSGGVLRLMTSPDGITWTRQGDTTYTVLSGKSYAAKGQDPQVRLLPNGTLELVCYNYTTSYDSSNYLCRATSTDGLTFTQTHEWFTETSPSFTAHLGEPAIANASGVRIMTFDACNVGSFTTAQRRIALAMLNPDYSVFGLNTTALNYGSPSFMSATVFDSFPVYDASESPTTLYLFFAGGSHAGSLDEMLSQIGLATAPVVRESTGGGVSAVAY